MFANAGGVRELALEERLLPQVNGRDRFLLRNLHAPGATHAVVVAVPVGRHAQLGFCRWSFVFGERANPQMRSARFEQQGRVGIDPAIHVFQGRIGATVAEKHGSFAGWTPPRDHFCRAHQYTRRQDLGWNRPSKTGHQVDQHLRHHQLAFRQSRHVAVMDYFMESYKGVAIRVAVITARPVYQQGPAQPEVLTRADVHGDIHRRGS